MVSSVIHCLSVAAGGFVQYGEQCDSLSICIISMVSGGFVQYGEQCDSFHPWSHVALCGRASSVIHSLSVLSPWF